MLSSVGRTWGQDMATGAQNRPGIGEDTALGVALARWTLAEPLVKAGEPAPPVGTGQRAWLKTHSFRSASNVGVGARASIAGFV